MTDSTNQLTFAYQDGDWYLSADIDRIQNPESLLRAVYGRLETTAGELSPGDNAVIETPEYLLLHYSEVHMHQLHILDDFRDCLMEFRRQLNQYPAGVVDGARHDLMLDAVFRSVDSLESMYWQTRFLNYEPSYREIRFLMELYAVANGLFDGEEMNKYSELYQEYVNVDGDTTTDEIYYMIKRVGQEFKSNTVQELKNTNIAYSKTKEWLSTLAIHPYQISPPVNRQHDRAAEVGVVVAGLIFLIQFAGIVRKLITGGANPADTSSLEQVVTKLNTLQEQSAEAFWEAIAVLEDENVKPGWLPHNVEVTEFYHSLEYSH